MRRLFEDLADRAKSGLERAQFETDKALRISKAKKEAETLEAEFKAKLQEMGRQTLELLEKGEISNASLASLSEGIAVLRVRLDAKESELALIKAETFEESQSTEGTPPPAAAEQSKFCPACGSPVPANAVFCPKCGNKLS